jgi:phospholipase/carboxylesterase
MTTPPIEHLNTYLRALIETLDALGYVTRHVDPIGYVHQLQRANLEPEPLRAALAMPPWPEPYSALRPVLDAGASYALAAVDGLIEAAGPPEDITQAWCALRYFPRALETLYPLAGILPQLNRFFLDASHRDNADLTRRLALQINDAPEAKPLDPSDKAAIAASWERAKQAPACTGPNKRGAL